MHNSVLDGALVVIHKFNWLIGKSDFAQIMHLH